jgi:biopolymer transport protein ExbD
MRRLSIKIVIASLTFLIGLSTQRLLDYFVTDKLVETIVTCSEYGRTLMLFREPSLVPPAVTSCGHFVITVGDDRRLFLNSRPMARMDGDKLLIEELENAFRVRAKYHVYRSGMEKAFELPEEDRIDKTVYLRFGRSLSYGEVQDMIERLKAAGANPIGLVSDPPRRFADSEY